MTDLLLWLAMGAVLGFLRARSKLAASYRRSIETINSIADPAQRRSGKARIDGYRLGVCLLYACIGAIAGGLIWGAAALFVRFI